MNYEEFKELTPISDESNPFVKGFVFPSGETFFVEPAFYTQLINFKELYNEIDFARIIARMKEMVVARKKVIFTYDYESPFMEKEGFIHLEFTDVTDSLGILIDDKSRGSDYGD